jgi:predicted small lipoprotein YifL
MLDPFVARSRVALVLGILLSVAGCGRKPAPAAESNAPPEPADAARATAAEAPEHLRGDWAVYTYRVIGEPEMTEDEALALRGRPVTFTSDYVAFGADTCRHPTYHLAHLRADSVLTADYGATPSQFGFVGGPEAMIVRAEIRCGEQPWDGPAARVLSMPDGRVYTLWRGMFFQLERR